ncbi:MAG: hypothetical protein GY796_22255 [Chloroflexi bacterium]|nr:hypothetical protein [Chloroflexota bacterium]
MVNSQLRKLILLTFVLLLAACGNEDTSTPTPVTPDQQEVESVPSPSPDTGTSQEAYPPPTAVVTPETYPPPTAVAPQIAYPALNPNAILLAFDRPVQSTDTAVTGVGPPGLTIYVLNMTFMGEELGSGVIDSDGAFSIPVTALQPGTRVGVTADVTTVSLTEDDILPGEGEMSMPRVGYFYDSVVLPQE